MPANAETKSIDEQKLSVFIGKVVEDFGASLSSALSYIGIKLGLYKALAQEGPLTSTELSKETGTVERYIREWLINQAAGGYLEYDPKTERYTLPPEQAVALTDENSPFYVGGGFYVVKAMLKSGERIAEAFKKGGGMLWGEHDPDLFLGTERFFRPGYAAHLVKEWIPALSGVQEKLEKGGKVADIGCGHGASTILMAKAFPHSKFFGFDNHEPSIRRAGQSAKEAGVAGHINFQIASASQFPGEHYDLIMFFDCLHDMGDPAGAMKRTYETLSSQGSVLIVEPMAGNTPEENFNPVGRTFSAASTLCCTANSLALGGPALGAVATEKALREVILAAGFKNFRRAAETPFNRIFEARKN